MKRHVSRTTLFALAIASTSTKDGSLAAAAGSIAGGAGAAGGANWYLRAPDGSCQGPYALPLLGEWSSAGYVRLDSQVQWGVGGTPQLLGSVLRTQGSSGGGGRYASREMPDGRDGGRLGDNESSEEGGYNYRAAAQQLWSGQEDDSEDKPNPPRGRRASSGPYGARDEWGNSIHERVTSVEGGRWAESVAAAKKAVRNVFAGDRRGQTRQRRAPQSGSGRGRGVGRGGRYPQRSRGDLGSGNQQRANTRGSSSGEEYAVPGGYSMAGDRGRSSAEGRGEASQGQGPSQWDSSGMAGPGDIAWQAPLPPPSSARSPAGADGQALDGTDVLPSTASMAHPPPPPSTPSDWPDDKINHAHSTDEDVRGSMVDVKTVEEEGRAMPQIYPPPPQQPPTDQGPPASYDSPSGFPTPPGGVGEGTKGPGAGPAEPQGVVAAGTAGGLDPKEVEAFYAAQVDYGDGGVARGEASVAPAGEKNRWGRKSQDLSQEDLRALGLNYGEVDRASTASAGLSRGRRRELAGKVSVDSMKLQYDQGWLEEAGDGGLFARLRSILSGSVATLPSPAKGMASATPIAVVRMMFRATGWFPLMLWWSFSIAQGVLPALIFWSSTRLLEQLSGATAGRYIFSPAEFQAVRGACSILASQHLGLGLSLAATGGVVRGWLQPRARERSAALSRRALASVCVAGGRDRPRAGEFRELSLAPWTYANELMKLSRAVAGIVAAAAALHLVWPGRGPVVLGGAAALVLLGEMLFLWLAVGGETAWGNSHAAHAEELTGGINYGAIASAEAETRGLRQVLLDRGSALLEEAELSGRRKVVTASAALARVTQWLIMGAGAAYAVLAAVDEELDLHFGRARVVLALTQVWFAHFSLQQAVHSLGQLKRLRPLAARMHAMARTSNTSGGSLDGSTEGGWANDGPESSDGLRVEGVSFTPAGRISPALSRVDLHVPGGSVVAVVGSAGAGKTTLLQMALGIIKAEEGVASFQGRPLGEWESNAYRSRVAWLNQAAARFPLSAGENIGAGDATEFSNRHLWARAAGLSGISSAIELLPLGYDTLLEEGGPAATAWSAESRSGLSEGEWQRLQLSRFLMRADVAKLLLLDEPFQGVHPAEASRMLAALGAQARATGQVVVVASQDLSVGRWADRTVLLEAGSVVEAGSWEELLASGGPFASALRERDML